MAPVGPIVRPILAGASSHLLPLRRGWELPVPKIGQPTGSRRAAYDCHKGAGDAIKDLFAVLANGKAHWSDARLKPVFDLLME